MIEENEINNQNNLVNIIISDKKEEKVNNKNLNLSENDKIQKSENILNSKIKKPKENHGKCVPLELYQKVYNDRKKLLDKVNNFNLILKQKEN